MNLIHHACYLASIMCSQTSLAKLTTLKRLRITS
uniref:Uncharacterized protein n=1 Tax=Anguilla anguilla TaxID=7936 RepID=A0A0E9VDS3_ANGAN